MQPQSLAHFLARIVAATPPQEIGAAAMERAKVSLLHNLTVALAGRRVERVAHEIAWSHYRVPAEATLLASGRKASIEAAAFANGALFHVRSQDDTHPGSTSHPGGPVMAAALALGETCSASGEDFLAAIVLGYEALCRIGRDFDQQITARGFRTAAVLGGFGSAAAAARLMRLEEDRTAHALGLVAHLAGGLAQVWIEGSPEYPLQLGNAARNGIAASRAAASGARAALNALDGRRGFFNAFAGATAEAVEATGNFERWQIEEATLKPFPACAILQGPLELLLRMLGEVEGREVQALRLHLSPYEASYPGIDNSESCASAAAAKMSAQFCLGNAIGRRRLAFSDLEDYADPGAIALSRRVTVVPDKDLADRQCRIHIRWRDGDVSEERLMEPVGRPAFSEVAAFALGMASEMEMRSSDVAALIEIVAGLEHEASLERLILTLTARPTAGPS
jgi:2-methylcitrate dehydratase PrpD